MSNDLFSPGGGYDPAAAALGNRIVAIREAGHAAWVEQRALQAQAREQEMQTLLKPPALPAENIGVDFGPFASEFSQIVLATTQKLQALERTHYSQLVPLRNQLDQLREQIAMVVGGRSDALIAGRVGEARLLGDRKTELEIQASRVQVELSSLEARQAAEVARVYENQQNELDTIMRRLHAVVDETRNQLEQFRMTFGQAAGARRARAQEVAGAAQQASYTATQAQQDAQARLQSALHH